MLEDETNLKTNKEAICKFMDRIVCVNKDIVLTCGTLWFHQERIKLNILQILQNVCEPNLGKKKCNNCIKV